MDSTAHNVIKIHCFWCLELLQCSCKIFYGNISLFQNHDQSGNPFFHQKWGKVNLSRPCDHIKFLLWHRLSDGCLRDKVRIPTVVCVQLLITDDRMSRNPWRPFEKQLNSTEIPRGSFDRENKSTTVHGPSWILLAVGLRLDKRRNPSQRKLGQFSSLKGYSVPFFFFRIQTLNYIFGMFPASLTSFSIIPL